MSRVNHGTRILAFCACLAMAAGAALAQGRPWLVAKDFTSPIDAKRTLLISAGRDGVSLTVGCNLQGPIVTVDFGNALLPARSSLAGKYRVDQRPPVEVTWDASASQAASLTGEPARELAGALLDAAIWHIRVGEVERSIDPGGLGEYAPRLREACGIVPAGARRS